MSDSHESERRDTQGAPDVVGCLRSEEEASRAALAKRMGAGILGGVLVVLGLGISLGSAIRTYGFYPDDPGKLGELTGSALAPLFLAMISVGVYYTARKQRRTRGRVAFYIAVWTFVIALLAVGTGRESGEQRLKHDIGQMFKEARDPSLAAEKERGPFMDIAVEFFMMLAERNEQYTREAERFNTPELGRLYTTESFADGGSMRRTIKQLRELAEFEKGYASLEALWNRFDERVMAMDADTKSKEDFLRGFDESMPRSLVLRDRAFQRAFEWIRSAVELYEFAMEHSSGVNLQDGTVLFDSGDEIVAQFDQLLGASLERHKIFLSVFEEFNNAQTRTLEEYGLTSSDVGLPEGE